MSVGLSARTVGRRPAPRRHRAAGVMCARRLRAEKRRRPLSRAHSCTEITPATPALDDERQVPAAGGACCSMRCIYVPASRAKTSSASGYRNAATGRIGKHRLWAGVPLWVFLSGIWSASTPRRLYGSFGWRGMARPIRPWHDVPGGRIGPHERPRNRLARSERGEFRRRAVGSGEPPRSPFGRLSHGWRNSMAPVRVRYTSSGGVSATPIGSHALFPQHSSHFSANRDD